MTFSFEIRCFYLEIYELISSSPHLVVADVPVYIIIIIIITITIVLGEIGGPLVDTPLVVATFALSVGILHPKPTFNPPRIYFQVRQDKCLARPFSPALSLVMPGVFYPVSVCCIHLI